MASTSSMLPRFVGDGSAVDAEWILERTGLTCWARCCEKSLLDDGKTFQVQGIFDLFRAFFEKRLPV